MKKSEFKKLVLEVLEEEQDGMTINKNTRKDHNINEHTYVLNKDNNFETTIDGKKYNAIYNDQKPSEKIILKPQGGGQDKYFRFRMISPQKDSIVIDDGKVGDPVSSTKNWVLTRKDEKKKQNESSFDGKDTWMVVDGQGKVVKKLQAKDQASADTEAKRSYGPKIGKEFNVVSSSEMNQDEETVISSTSGTIDSATPQDKMKAKAALAKGDSVKTVKKGENIDEEKTPADYESMIKKAETTLKTAALAVKKARTSGEENADTKTLEGLVPALKSLLDDLKDNTKYFADKKTSDLKNTDSIDESNDLNETPEEISLSEQLDNMLAEMLTKFTSFSEGTEDKKYKRTLEGVVKHLNSAKTALEGVKAHEGYLSEKKAVEDEKKATKHVGGVEKALTKLVKDKEIVAKIMKKYPTKAAVALQAKMPDAAPDKVAKAMMSHFIKEQYHKK